MNDRFRQGTHITRASFPLRQCRSGPAPVRYHGSHRTAIAAFTVVLFFLAVLFCIPAAGADGVNLSTPQGVYYVIAGNEAVIPVTIVSTYNHDVTGTLSQAMIPENSGNSGPGNRSIQVRAFSAFTDERTVSLAVGESDIPADYLLTITFAYDENGKRSATLPGIVIHFVTSPVPASANQVSLASTDAADTVAVSSSSGPAPTGNPQAPGPAAALVNSQMPQDTRAFRDEMARKINQSAAEQDALLGYIAADPLMDSLNSSLSAAGYLPGPADIHPVSNDTGSFSLTYVSGTKSAVITGSVKEGHVPFAEESSHDPVLLPGALSANSTYREYAGRVAGDGFALNGTRINVTPEQESVNIAYSTPSGRMIHATAEIHNGTVVAFAGDNPDDPLAYAVPAAGLACVILLSAGIWYLARFREKDLPPAKIPEPAESPDKTAWRLLDEAEYEARCNRYPEAYRKTGRALRIYLSHTISDGAELTSGELEQLIGSHQQEEGTIRWVLDRCMAVGFAKDTPDSGEFQKLVRFSREIIGSGPAGKERPEPGEQDRV